MADRGGHSIPTDVLDYEILLREKKAGDADACKAVGRYCTIYKCSDAEWQKRLNEWYHVSAPRDDQAKKWFKSFCTRAGFSFYPMGPGQELSAADLRPGMIVATNMLKRAGMHYDWKFYKLTKLTPTGVWSAKRLNKERVDTENNSHSIDYTRAYCRPGEEVEGRRAQRLPGDLYYVWDPQYEADWKYGLYDGGVAYG